LHGGAAAMSDKKLYAKREKEKEERKKTKYPQKNSIKRDYLNT
jgi:hypothetical protein